MARARLEDFHSRHLGELFRINMEISTSSNIARRLATLCFNLIRKTWG